LAANCEKGTCAVQPIGPQEAVADAGLEISAGTASSADIKTDLRAIIPSAFRKVESLSLFDEVFAGCSVKNPKRVQYELVKHRISPTGKLWELKNRS
jgi:hypothetical protein